MIEFEENTKNFRRYRVCNQLKMVAPSVFFLYPKCITISHFMKLLKKTDQFNTSCLSWSQTYILYRLQTCSISSLTFSLHLMAIGSSNTSESYILPFPLLITIFFPTPLSSSAFFSLTWRHQSNILINSDFFEKKMKENLEIWSHSESHVWK